MVLAQRWSRFHGVLGIGALVAAGFLGTAANAQTQQQVEWCNNKDRAFAPDVAISGCTAAIQSHKEPQYLAFAYVNRGDAWEGKFDHDHAIADYNEAIRLSPFPRAFSNRGIVYFNRKDYDRAIADFTEAIRLDPNIASAFDDRAGAYQAKGDLDRAIADFTEVIRLIPNIAYVFNNRADAYKAKGELDRAIADYSEAIRLDPTNEFTYMNRGKLGTGRGISTARSPTSRKRSASIRSLEPITAAVLLGMTRGISTARSPTTRRRSASIPLMPLAWEPKAPRVMQRSGPLLPHPVRAQLSVISEPIRRRSSTKPWLPSKRRIGTKRKQPGKSL